MKYMYIHIYIFISLFIYIRLTIKQIEQIIASNRNASELPSSSTIFCGDECSLSKEPADVEESNKEESDEEESEKEGNKASITAKISLHRSK